MLFVTYPQEISAKAKELLKANLEKATGEKCFVLDMDCTGVYYIPEYARISAERGERQMYQELSYEKQTELHNQIILLLEKENCTVRVAKAILGRVARTIDGTAPVQFVSGIDHEF